MMGILFQIAVSGNLQILDLSGLSKSKLRIARNEIYARHHRKFDSADLQIYFDKKAGIQEQLSHLILMKRMSLAR